MENNDRNVLLTSQEAADMLGVARCTIYRWIDKKWIVAIRYPNKTFRIPKTAVNRMMDNMALEKQIAGKV